MWAGTWLFIEVRQTRRDLQTANAGLSLWRTYCSMLVVLTGHFCQAQPAWVRGFQLGAINFGPTSKWLVLGSELS
jgi:hypothetical protein